MICGRCGHKLTEESSICTRCRIAFPTRKKELTIRPVSQYAVLYRRMLIWGSCLALLLALVGEFVIGAMWQYVLLLAVGGAVGGVALALLPKLVLMTYFKLKLTAAKGRFSACIEKVTAFYGKRIEENEEDVEAMHELGIIYLITHNYRKAANCFEKARQAGSDLSRLDNHLGIALFLERDIPGAISAWKSSIESAMSNPAAHYNLGVAFTASRNPELSLSEFDNAVDEDREGVEYRLPIQLGTVYYESGRIEDAIREFEKAVKSGRDAGDARNNLGVACYRFGQIDRGMSEIHRVQVVEPGHARAYCNQGLIQLMNGNTRDAVNILYYASKMDEVSAPIHTYLGLALYEAGDVSAGINELEKAVKMMGADYDAHYNLGKTYIAEGEVERGVDQIKKALAVDPYDVGGLVHLGAAYFIRDKFEDAEKLFRQVSEKNPDDVVSMNNLGMSLVELGRADEALPVLKRACDMSGSVADIHFNLAYAYQLLDKPSEASVHYKAATNLSGEMIAGHYNRGVCFLLLEQWNAAVAELRKVISINPEVYSAYYPLGFAYQSKKDITNALSNWAIAVQHDPKNADLHTNLGLAYYLRDKPEKAIEHFQRSLRLREGGSDDDYNNLALAYVKKGAMDLAIRNFEKSIEVSPVNPVTHSNLGLAYYLSKEPEKALVEWTRVSALDPNYARRRGSIETATYDDTQMAFLPFNWRQHIFRIAPLTAPPRYRLMLGYNKRPWWLEIKDEDVVLLSDLERDVEHWERATNAPPF